MEKIILWWTNFLVELEAGKRAIAIFIIITIFLTYFLIKTSNKLDEARIDKSNSEKLHGMEISKIKDSVSADKSRYMSFYNEKTENIYKQQLEQLKEIEKGYKIIKSKNDKIVSKSIYNKN